MPPPPLKKNLPNPHPFLFSDLAHFTKKRKKKKRASIRFTVTVQRVGPQLTGAIIALGGAADGQQEGLRLDGGQHDVQFLLGRRFLFVLARGHGHIKRSEGAQGWHSNATTDTRRPVKLNMHSGSSLRTPVTVGSVNDGAWSEQPNERFGHFSTSQPVLESPHKAGMTTGNLKRENASPDAGSIQEIKSVYG